MIEHDNARYYRSDAAVREYTGYDHLMEAEAAVLRLLVSEGLGSKRMLDLGVGGGRTAVHFAPAAGEYVGVDYSAPLVEACRRRFADSGWEHARFEVADARDLSRWPDGSFGFALFSWNGLDAIPDEDGRLRALREIRRVLEPGARFCFSAHNLEHALAPAALPRRLLRRMLNPGLGRLARSDAGYVADERVGLKWERHYYIRPAAQLVQLLEVGFTDPVALRPDGTQVASPTANEFADRHWLYYLARA